MNDAACRHHNHVRPTEAEITAALAKAHHENASVPLRVAEAR
jgi:hypothetical protein